MLDLLINKVPHQFEPHRLSSGLVTFLNPVSYLKARANPELFKHFDYILIDGWFLVRRLQRVGIFTQRYSFDMTSLAPVVLRDAEANNKTVYCIGTTPAAIPGFIATIKKEFPALNLVGWRHGYFNSGQERTQVLHEIASLNPDVVVVGKGTPLQEQFLVDLRLTTKWSGMGYTCGGFMHQTSDRLHYYPSLINRLHLRMPYRLLREKHFRARLPNYFRFLRVFRSDVVTWNNQALTAGITK